MSVETAVRKETEVRPGIQLHFVYHPGEIADKLLAIPQIEQATEGFFSTDPGTTNIFAIETPFMAGLNIPHFFEWQKRTSRYFEGYMQHTVTGFQKGKPYSDEELAQSREEISDTYRETLGGRLRTSEDDKNRLQFYFSLLMLDRLAEKRSFRLVVEPGNNRSFMSMIRQTGRFLRRMEKEGESIDEAVLDTPEKLLEALEEGLGKKYRGAAELIAPRVSSFHGFMENTIADAAKIKGLVRILVPREVGYYSLDHAKFQTQRAKRVGFEYTNPDFINCDPSTSVEDVSLRFLSNPNADVTREELIEEAIFGIVNQGLSVIGQETDSKHFQQFRGHFSSDDLYTMLVSFFDDERGAMVNLLNLYGEKTSGSTLGTAYDFLLGINRGEPGESILGKRLREAIDIHRTPEDS